MSLVISVLLHAALMAWALVTIHHAPDDKPPVIEPVAVAIVTADDITRLRKGDRNAKQLEAEAKESPRPDPPKKEAPTPTPTVAAPPPPPPPPEPPPPEPARVEPPPPDPIAQKMAALEKEPPGPTPEERKRLDDKLEQERVAAEQRRKEAEEQKKKDEARREAERLAKLKRDKDEKERKEREAKAARDKKQKEFNADKLADLLNKMPDKGAPAAAVEKSETKSKSKGPVAGAPEGRDTRLTASELGLLVRLIKQCVDSQYRRLNGSSEADRLVFDMRIRLNQDGTLIGAPQVTNAQNSPFFLAASENAIRAAKSCEPYQLPLDKYAYWKDVILEFGRN